MLLFTAPGVWGGCELGLDLYFGKVEIGVVRTALATLWNHPSLDGCWLSQQAEPETQMRVLTEIWHPEERNTLCGVATAPDQCRCNCKTVVTALDDGLHLVFLLPIQGLLRCYTDPAADDYDQARAAELCEWLHQLAASVFQTVPFLSGLIGFNTEIAEDDAFYGPIPAQRWYGYLRNEHNSLTWYRPTELSHLFGG